MENLTIQLQKYWESDDTIRQVERNKFFKLLSVKLFEYSINDKDISIMFKDFRKAMEQKQVDKFNKLTRAFSDISEVLFN
jgi:hypothetical protein